MKESAKKIEVHLDPSFRILNSPKNQYDPNNCEDNRRIYGFILKRNRAIRQIKLTHPKAIEIIVKKKIGNSTKSGLCSKSLIKLVK